VLLAEAGPARRARLPRPPTIPPLSSRESRARSAEEGARYGRTRAVSPLYVAALGDLLDFYPLLPPDLSQNGAGYYAALAFLRNKDDAAELAARRHELLVCIANARREQESGARRIPGTRC
jgi:hypothetical protein